MASFNDKHIKERNPSNVLQNKIILFIILNQFVYNSKPFSDHFDLRAEVVVQW